MTKKKSFIHHIFIYLLISISSLLCVLGAFLFSSYNILENEISDSSSAFLSIYSNELQNKTSQMDTILKSVTAQGVELAKIKSSNENDRTLNAISLKNYMQNIITNNSTTADVIVVYDDNYEICLDAISPGVTFQEKEDLRDYTKQVIRQNQENDLEWDFLQINGEVYLYKMLTANDRAIAIYIKAGRLLDTLLLENNDNRIVVLVDKQGVIGKIWSDEIDDIFVGSDIRSINTDEYYSRKQVVIEDQLILYCLVIKNSLLQQSDFGMFVVAVLAMVAVGFMGFIVFYTRREIADPMKLIVAGMSRIKNGEYNNRIDINYKTKEFEMLQETTNQMVDEIVDLKIKTYEKQIELKDMELKTIKLQLKPHFFLNALTTIASLSSQNKNKQINIYIDALSKNVRYMFRAGLHTVPVKEELRYLAYYFEMQELKYPGCVFYFIDIENSLDEWEIPQMLVHTFVENEFKHAVSMDTTLTILIKISKVTHVDEDMLLIEIEDDGKGYPIDVLEYMSADEKAEETMDQRIGLWSIKKMMEIMYDRKGLVTVKNIEPHGCLNQIYVPKKTVNEIIEGKSKYTRERK